MNSKVTLYPQLRRALVMALTTMVITIIAAVTPKNADTAGLLIADGGFGGILEIKEHDVNVTINNGIAVTKITEVFHNTENRQVEALYTFPVPKHASIANFKFQYPRWRAQAMGAISSLQIILRIIKR